MIDVYLPLTMGPIQTHLLLVVASCVTGTDAFLAPPPQVFVLPDTNVNTASEELRQTHEDMKDAVEAVNVSLSKLSVKVDTIKEEETVKDAELSSVIQSVSNQQQTFQQEISQSVSDGAKKDKELEASFGSMKTEQEEFEKGIRQAVDQAVAKDDVLSSAVVSITSLQNVFQNEISKSVEDVVKKDEEIVSSLNTMKTEQGEFNGKITKEVEDGDRKDAELSSVIQSVSNQQHTFQQEISQSVSDGAKKDEEIVSSLDTMKTEQEEFKGQITQEVEEGDRKVSDVEAETGRIRTTQTGLKTKLDQLDSTVSDIEAETGRIRTTQTGLITKLDQLNSSLVQMENKLSTELKEGLETQKAVDEQLMSVVEDVKKQLEGLVSNAGSKENTDLESSAGSRDEAGKPEGFTSCQGIKESGSSYQDGEYDIYPPIFGGKKIKVWCHDMAGTPKEYITLHEDNEGNFPDKQNLDCSSKDSGGKIQGRDASKVGENRFIKIRVDINTMVVDRNDRTFARADGAEYPYGYAGDCYTTHNNGQKSSCGTEGFFNIDTSETGLIVKPSLTWKAEGYMPYCEVQRSNKNTKITIRCGGACGWCEPDGDMVLELNPNEDDDDDDYDDDGAELGRGG